MTFQPQDFKLAEIAKTIQSWLDYSTASRVKKSLVTDDNTHIMSLPVPYWPSHGQLKAWIAALTLAAEPAKDAGGVGAEVDELLVAEMLSDEFQNMSPKERADHVIHFLHTNDRITGLINDTRASSPTPPIEGEVAEAVENLEVWLNAPVADYTHPNTSDIRTLIRAAKKNVPNYERVLEDMETIDDVLIGAFEHERRNIRAALEAATKNAQEKYCEQCFNVGMVEVERRTGNQRRVACSVCGAGGEKDNEKNAQGVEISESDLMYNLRVHGVRDYQIAVEYLSDEYPHIFKIEPEGGKKK